MREKACLFFGGKDVRLYKAARDERSPYTRISRPLLLHIINEIDCYILSIAGSREVNNMLRGLFQPMHLVIILAIVLIIFGPGKLPEIGASLGKGIKELKKALSHDEKDSPSEVRKEITSEDTPEKKT